MFNKAGNQIQIYDMIWFHYLMKLLLEIFGSYVNGWYVVVVVVVVVVVEFVIVNSKVTNDHSILQNQSYQKLELFFFARVILRSGLLPSRLQAPESRLDMDSRQVIPDS
ncbi:unnamed protein product [Ambrosiozyma monospora]|uniref:Unnamed protein product n=1 Tax=Ambrosiozyma monospora TaxID=43982 RepID=A0A9W7DDI3_AMBMO|nr:unnamed protein product [Ambrosiozyma monospora]